MRWFVLLVTPDMNAHVQISWKKGFKKLHLKFELFSPPFGAHHHEIPAHNIEHSRIEIKRTYAHRTNIVWCFVTHNQSTHINSRKMSNSKRNQEATVSVSPHGYLCLIKHYQVNGEKYFYIYILIWTYKSTFYAHSVCTMSLDVMDEFWPIESINWDTMRTILPKKCHLAFSCLCNNDFVFLFHFVFVIFIII